MAYRNLKKLYNLHVEGAKEILDMQHRQLQIECD